MELLEVLPAERCAARDVDARVKLLACLGLVLAGVSTPPGALEVFGAYFALVLLALAASRANPRQVLGRAAALMPCAALVALGLPFIETSGVSRWPLAWSVLAKAGLGLLAVNLLLATTPVAELLEAASRLGAPAPLVLLTGFTHRYLFVFHAEARRMWRGREARCYRGRWLWHAGVLGKMLATLFLRGYERGERVFLAMRARGFEGQAPRPGPGTLRARDAALLALWLALLLAVRLAA